MTIEPTMEQFDAAMAMWRRLNSQLSMPLLMPHMLRAALNVGAPIDGAGWAEAAFDDHRPLTGNHPCVDPRQCGWRVP